MDTYKYIKDLHIKERKSIRQISRDTGLSRQTIRKILYGSVEEVTQKSNAQLRPGVEIVLETTRFEEKVKEADLVITGEGRTDFQTAFGKAPVGVAAIAEKNQVPTVCLSGGLG
ncbi:glycerate kinase [Heliorestis acidaminivorans]|uniref:glycerate kinase n=1 Tax=Heliorestis acidaminivorans TaxID=553427 RepID=UPI001FAB11CA|nr:glycerate kinase [Heliorestis acidaminivorans]